MRGPGGRLLDQRKVFEAGEIKRRALFTIQKDAHEVFVHVIRCIGIHERFESEAATGRARKKNAREEHWSI